MPQWLTGWEACVAEGNLNSSTPCLQLAKAETRKPCASPSSLSSSCSTSLVVPSGAPAVFRSILPSWPLLLSRTRGSGVVELDQCLLCLRPPWLLMGPDCKDIP